MRLLSHAVQTWRLMVRGEMALESIGIEGQTMVRHHRILKALFTWCARVTSAHEVQIARQRMRGKQLTAAMDIWCGRTWRGEQAGMDRCARAVRLRHRRRKLSSAVGLWLASYDAEEDVEKEEEAVVEPEANETVKEEKVVLVEPEVTTTAPAPRKKKKNPPKSFLPDYESPAVKKSTPRLSKVEEKMVAKEEVMEQHEEEEVVAPLSPLSPLTPLLAPSPGAILSPAMKLSVSRWAAAKEAAEAAEMAAAVAAEEAATAAAVEEEPMMAEDEEDDEAEARAAIASAEAEARAVIAAAAASPCKPLTPVIATDANLMLSSPASSVPSPGKPLSFSPWSPKRMLLPSSPAPSNTTCLHALPAFPSAADSE